MTGRYLIHALRVLLHGFVKVCHQCGWFRAEQNSRIGRMVKQRFDAQAIADQEKPLLTQVPYRKSENSLEPFSNLISPLQEAMQHNLRIASGAELMTIAFLLIAKPARIVDFAAVA